MSKLQSPLTRFATRDRPPSSGPLSFCVRFLTDESRNVWSTCYIASWNDNLLKKVLLSPPLYKQGS